RKRLLLGARLLSAGLSRHGGAGVILSSALQAIGLFIATNIDDIIVLSLFFAAEQAHAEPTPAFWPASISGSPASSAWLCSSPWARESSCPRRPSLTSG